MGDILKKMEAAAASYESELREFRLTGDLSYLQGFVETVISATNSEGADLLWNDFHDSITDKENLALAGIRDEIGNEGYVSVVKMIQKTNISRPVFTSLLSKLQTFKVAVVENKGVKGTYIKFQEIASGSM
jgi:hypothetical protein